MMIDRWFNIRRCSTSWIWPGLNLLSMFRGACVLFKIEAKRMMYRMLGVSCSFSVNDDGCCA